MASEEKSKKNFPSVNLNPASPVPLYYQLVREIRGMVDQGHLAPGEPFWSEGELQTACDVSRTTVRAAVKELALAGYLVVQRGKRSFISKPKISRGFPGLTGFSEDMRKRGLAPSSRILEFSRLTPDPALAVLMSLEKGERVVRFRRQMLADGEPLGYHIVHLPEMVWNSIGVEPSHLERNSLYQTLEEKGGLVLAEARETIEVGWADKETAAALEIKKGQPILVMKRFVYTPEGSLIEYAVNIYRADRYKYEIHHSRQKSG